MASLPQQTRVPKKIRLGSQREQKGPILRRGCQGETFCPRGGGGGGGKKFVPGIWLLTFDTGPSWRQQAVKLDLEKAWIRYPRALPACNGVCFLKAGVSESFHAEELSALPRLFLIGYTEDTLDRVRHKIVLSVALAQGLIGSLQVWVAIPRPAIAPESTYRSTA